MAFRFRHSPLLRAIPLISLLLPISAYALSQGPLSAGTGADDGSYGIASWSNTSNITSEDSAEAEAFAGEADVPTHYLVATNFGFTIPSGNTINGVIFEAKKTEHCQPSIENRIYLVKGGVISTAVNRSTGAYWGFGSYETYGSSSDLWGTTIAYTDVNATDFGIALSAISAGNSCMGVDHVRATVHYSADGGGPVPEFSTWALLALVGAGIVLLKKEGLLGKIATEHIEQ